MSSDGEPDRSRNRRRSTSARPTDDELLDAARSVFVERGFVGATMEAIAERADSTKPTLYAHFGDKQALYEALISREADSLGRWMLSSYESAADMPTEARMHAHVMALFDYAAGNPASFRLVFGWTSADGPKAMSARRRVVHAVLEQVVLEVRRTLAEMGRVPGRSAELLASMLVGLTNGAARHAASIAGIDPAAVGELTAQFIAAATTRLDFSVLDNIDNPE
jgi:AcrR family transcriptional regulator